MTRGRWSPTSGFDNCRPAALSYDQWPRCSGWLDDRSQTTRTVCCKSIAHGAWPAGPNSLRATGPETQLRVIRQRRGEWRAIFRNREGGRLIRVWPAWGKSKLRQCELRRDTKKELKGVGSTNERREREEREREGGSGSGSGRGRGRERGRERWPNYWVSDNRKFILSICTGGYRRWKAICIGS